LKAEYQSTKDYRPSWPFVKAEWRKMALATGTKILFNLNRALSALTEKVREILQLCKADPGDIVLSKRETT